MPSLTQKRIKRSIVAHCHHCLDFFSIEAVMGGRRIVKLEEHPHIFYRYLKPHHTCCRNGKAYLTFYF